MLIQIIKCPSDLFYYYESSDTLPMPCSNWIEVEGEELEKLENAVRDANSLDKKDVWRYKILYQVGRERFNEIFESADAFIRQVQKRQEDERKRKEEYERTKAEKARERKRKQLEKLKKELGEE